MKTMDLIRRIQQLERVSKPEQQQVLIVRLVDSVQSPQELPSEPSEWLTWPMAEKRSWTASGVKVITVSCQDEMQARAAVGNA